MAGGHRLSLIQAWEWSLVLKEISCLPSLALCFRHLLRGSSTMSELTACQCGTPVAVKAMEKKHGDFLVVWLMSSLSGPLPFGLFYGMPSWAVRVLVSMSNGLNGHRGMGRKKHKENFEGLARHRTLGPLPPVPSIQTLDLRSSGCWGFPWQVATPPPGEVYRMIAAPCLVIYRCQGLCLWGERTVVLFNKYTIYI